MKKNNQGNMVEALGENHILQTLLAVITQETYGMTHDRIHTAGFTLGVQTHLRSTRGIWFVENVRKTVFVVCVIFTHVARPVPHDQTQTYLEA